MEYGSHSPPAMNYPAAPSSGISASLRQATGYQPEYFYRPKGRGIKTLSAAGGLVRRRIKFEICPDWM